MKILLANINREEKMKDTIWQLTMPYELGVHAHRYTHKEVFKIKEIPMHTVFSFTTLIGLLAIYMLMSS